MGIAFGCVCLLMCITNEDMWKAQIYSYRDRFRRLDRKWHALIGSQLLFGFMVSTALMGKIVKLLKKGNGHGQLIVQTNCEDVAVFLRDRALDFGLLSIPAQVSVESPSSEGRLPERTAEWVRLGGERAIGPEWFAEPVLPDRCATETEVACQIQGTPIHRCVFQTKDL